MDELFGLGDFGGAPRERQRVLHHRLDVFAGAVPFQHGEFRRVQTGALAIAEHPGEFKYPCLARRQQFLGGEFRRGVEIKRLLAAIGPHPLGGEGMKMRLIAGRGRQYPALDLGKILGLKPGAQTVFDPPPEAEERAAVGVLLGIPPGHLSQPSLPAKDPANIGFEGNKRRGFPWFRLSPAPCAKATSWRRTASSISSSPPRISIPARARPLPIWKCAVSATG